MIHNLNVSLFYILTCLHRSSIKISHPLASSPPTCIFPPPDPEWANSKFLLPLDLNNNLCFLNTEKNLCSSPGSTWDPSSRIIYDVDSIGALNSQQNSSHTQDHRSPLGYWSQSMNTGDLPQRQHPLPYLFFTFPKFAILSVQSLPQGFCKEVSFPISLPRPLPALSSLSINTTSFFKSEGTHIWDGSLLLPPQAVYFYLNVIKLLPLTLFTLRSSMLLIIHSSHIKPQKLLFLTAP